MDIQQLVDNESEEFEVEWRGLTVKFKWRPGHWSNDAVRDFNSGDSEITQKRLAELVAWWDLTETVPDPTEDEPKRTRTRSLPITAAAINRLPVPVQNQIGLVIIKDIAGPVPNPEASPPTSSPGESSADAPNGTTP
jgi:hypothetical protein